MRRSIASAATTTSLLSKPTTCASVVGMTREERFWKTVEKSESCWICTNAVGSHGYAQFASGLAHRYSYELHFGPIPDGAMVLHRPLICSDRRCVRPEHLYAGTHQDNMDDVVRAGGHPRRKLSDSAVAEIRNSNEKQRTLAARFGVTQRTISNVRLRKTYRSISLSA